MGDAQVAAEAKQLRRQAAKDEQSRAQSEDFHRNVFQPVFFTAVSAAPGAQLGMAVPLVGKGLLIAGTFAASYKGTEVATGEKTELLAKGGPRVIPYESCGDLMTCERFWDGVSAGSELLLSFTGGAAMTRAEGGRLFMRDVPERVAAWLEGQLSREVEISLPPLRDEVTGAELLYSNPLPRIRLKGPSGQSRRRSTWRTTGIGPRSRPLERASLTMSASMARDSVRWSTLNEP